MALHLGGMDSLEVFLPTSGQQRFFIVIVDYFTKYLEVELLASIIKKQVEGFV